MTKRAQQEYTQRKDLQREGWQVEKTDSVKFNGGSESPEHFLAKSATAYTLRDKNYRVSTEVTNDAGDSEIDVIAYGQEGKPFAVEVETGLTSDVKSSKLERYVFSNAVIRECFFIEVEDVPLDFGVACEFVEDELF